jgi:hypothetical protein
MQPLSDVFGDRIISSGIWPARSPYLNTCDFFHLGLFDGQSLQKQPPNGRELKENISKEIENIPAEQLQRVKKKLFRRCEE